MNLRNTLRKIAHQHGLKGEYTHDEVIAELRSKYSQLIDMNREKLENMALRRILADVEARQPKLYESGQNELFPELAGLPEACDANALGLSEKSGARVLLQSLTIKLAYAYAEYKRPKRNNISPSDKLREYLQSLQGYVKSDEDLLSDVIKRSRASPPRR